MECAEHDAVCGLLIKHGFHARIHFLGGFVGECDREDLPRADAFVGDQISDTLCQNARLAGARTCHDQNGSIGGCDGFALLRIKFIKEVHG